VYLPTELALDLLASWSRLFIALGLSIVFSVIVGITAATNRKAEGAILPVLDILQTLPILAFFPVVIYVIVSVIPNFIGINLAVILLIFTSMSWNITFGVYEAIKAIPSDFVELARLNHMSGLRLVSELYIPAAMPRIAYQSVISWSVGLFYLVTSEIFSIGSHNFSVTYGIGAEIARLVLQNNPVAYAVAVVSLIAAIIVTDILFLRPLSLYSERFSFSQEQKQEKKSIVLDFYRSVGELFAKILPKFKIRSGREGSSIVNDRETRKEKVERSRAVLIFVILVCAIFAIMTIAYNDYAYLPLIASALAASFVRVWIMYIVCAAISIPVGIRIAKSQRLYVPAMSILQVISAIPATILLPAIVAVLFIMPFGNELTALAVIFLSMIWYLLFSVVSGMRTMPGEFRDLTRILRMKWTDAWRNVYVPAVLPSFVTGSITAVGGAWNALIIAEYFSIETSPGSATCMTQLQGSMCVLTQVGNGIGKLLDTAAFSGNLVEMGLALAAMVVMVVVINKLVWQRVYKKVTLRYRMDV
jgi:NitT/TauT family transport system permease protein